MQNTATELRLAVDIGGTFTDTVLMRGASDVVATCKTPTTPNDPATGALNGAERALAQAGATLADVTTFIHGTTLATNALIERRGATVATVTTAGFRDILEIAYERRYEQYAIDIQKPDLNVPRSRAFTIGGRMDVDGFERAPLDEAGVERLLPTSARQARTLWRSACCIPMRTPRTRCAFGPCCKPPCPIW